MRSLDLLMVRNHICILLYNLQFWDFFVKLLSIDSSESGQLSISAKDLTFAPNLNQERRVVQKESGFSMASENSEQQSPRKGQKQKQHWSGMLEIPLATLDFCTQRFSPSVNFLFGIFLFKSTL